MAVFGFIAIAFVVLLRQPSPPTTAPTVVPTVPPSVVASPLSPRSAANLPTAVAQTPFSLDTVNDIEILQRTNATVRVVRGTPLRVRGWAVDAPNNAPAGGVTISIDNAVDIPATYGAERPDVAQSLGKPAYLRAGFSADIPTDTLTPGRHLLTIKIVAQDGRSYYQPPQAVEIEVV